MAKRFTDTDKYKKPFLRGLQGAYKLLWDYICNDCNHAGIWIVDFEIAQIYLGKDMPVNRVDALRFFNADKMRVIEIGGGSQWFIKSFIEFQYGPLNPQNRAHSSVINCLKSFELWSDEESIIKPLTSPLQGAMDKDKDKDKDKEKEIEGGLGETLPTETDQDDFENPWNLYGKKGNKKTSAARWSKLSAKTKNLALEHIPRYVESTPNILFRKNFETYINQEAWNDEIIISDERSKNTISGATITGNEKKYGSTAATKGAIIAEARELDRRRAAKPV